MSGKAKNKRLANDGVEQHVAEIIERLAVDCVLDVGANEGQWAAALRRAGYSGRIISFEPSMVVFQRLQTAAAHDPLWDTHGLALGSQDGTIALHRTHNSVLSSVLNPSRYARSLKVDQANVVAVETVPIRRLDGLLPELLPDLATARLFLKMDTQGFDRQVFEGAKGVLPRIVGLQSELSVFPLYDGMTDWLEALSAFTQAGYSPTGFFPVVRTLPYGVLCEFDCVMVRHARLTATPLTVNEPPVTVVVTAVADSPALRTCLAHVRTQAHELGGEVLLVMNTAPAELSDEARQALEGHCDRLTFEARVGKSHALNTAVSLSRGQVIAFTDDDAEPLPGWLAAITAALLAPDRDAALVGCGGPVLPVYPDGPVPDWFRAMIEGGSTAFLTPRHDLGAVPRDYEVGGKASRSMPPGANCAYRREVFTSYHYEPRLGPNREMELLGGEDVLLGRLLLRDGYRLRYCPDARVRHPVHPERMTEASLRRSYYVHGIESMRISLAMSRESRLPKITKSRRKLRRKLRVLRLKLLLALLPWPMRLPVIRLRWLAKYEFLRGQIAELKRSDYDKV